MAEIENLEGALARPEMAHFDSALEVGGTIQAWQSASGLRMVRIVSPYDEIWGFGKHPHADPALIHAAVDYSLGHIPNAYDEGGHRFNHLIGSLDAETEIDKLIRRDGELKSYKKDGQVVCEVTANEATPVITEDHWAILERWQDVVIEDSPPGCKIRVYPKCRGGDGGVMAGMELLEAPEGVIPWDFNYLQSAAADTFAEAVTLALRATRIYKPKGYDTFTPFNP